jgi:hypothetical protein
MITEKEAEKAAEYIRANASVYAKAKSDRIYLEQYRKSQKAILFNECEEKTVQAKESYAYAHPEYLANIEALGHAVEKEETVRWKFVAAQQKIELYRTQQANNRAIDNGHR